MPVELKIRFSKGWKKEKNKRYGDALVVRFVNTENNETMFEYSPKLNDKHFWDMLFKILDVYDEFLVAERAREMRGDKC